MAMIKIEVDDKSGFCTGVIKAVRTAENNIEISRTLSSLGELVHNPEEVRRLKNLGLDSVTYEEFDRLENTTVLIRAHGEPPETFQKAKKQNIRLIDATCPIVKKLQKQIRDSYTNLRGKQGSLLIFGKSSHPEVRALVGQTRGSAIVLGDPGELATLELTPPVFLFSQTTMNLEEYNNFQEFLKNHMKDLGQDPDLDLHIHHTICKQVSSREKYLRDFVVRHDLVFFVSGKKSSNGKALFKICRKINDKTHFISNPEESDAIDLAGITTIGICGATSTPAWLLSAVKKRLEERINIRGT